MIILMMAKAALNEGKTVIIAVLDKTMADQYK